MDSLSYFVARVCEKASGLHSTQSLTYLHLRPLCEFVVRVQLIRLSCDTMELTLETAKVL